MIVIIVKNDRKSKYSSGRRKRIISNVFHCDLTKAGFCVKMNFTCIVCVRFTFLIDGSESGFFCHIDPEFPGNQ